VGKGRISRRRQALDKSSISRSGHSVKTFGWFSRHSSRGILIFAASGCNRRTLAPPLVGARILGAAACHHSFCCAERVKERLRPHVTTRLRSLLLGHRATTSLYDSIAAQHLRWALPFMPTASTMRRLRTDIQFAPALRRMRSPMPHIYRVLATCAARHQHAINFPFTEKLPYAAQKAARRRHVANTGLDAGLARHRSAAHICARNTIQRAPAYLLPRYVAYIACTWRASTRCYCLPCAAFAPPAYAVHSPVLVTSPKTSPPAACRLDDAPRQNSLQENGQRFLLLPLSTWFKTALRAYTGGSALRARKRHAQRESVLQCVWC